MFSPIRPRRSCFQPRNAPAIAREPQTAIERLIGFFIPRRCRLGVAAKRQPLGHCRGQHSVIDHHVRISDGPLFESREIGLLTRQSDKPQLTGSEGRWSSVRPRTSSEARPRPHGQWDERVLLQSAIAQFAVLLPILKNQVRLPKPLTSVLLPRQRHSFRVLHAIVRGQKERQALGLWRSPKPVSCIRRNSSSTRAAIAARDGRLRRGFTVRPNAMLRAQSCGGTEHSSGRQSRFAVRAAKGCGRHGRQSRPLPNPIARDWR